MTDDQIKSLAETLEAERDRHIGGYQGPRRYVAQLLDKAASALTDLEAENARLRERLAEALKALEEAADALDRERWKMSTIGAPTSEYFQDKHGLQIDLYRIKEQAAAARRVREGGKVDG